MKLRDIPKVILSKSPNPLSAKEIWAEAVKQGLDKVIVSSGKTPWDSITAFLYTTVKKSGSDIVAVGTKPVRFKLNAKEKQNSIGTVVSETENSNLNVLPNGESAHTINDKAHNSKFLGPCLEVLSAQAPSPMGVGQILKAILKTHPELPWKQSNGAVRAALMRASKDNKEIQMVPDSIPPLFFVNDSANAQSSPLSSNAASQSVTNTYSFLKCAENVLREFGGGKPMHYSDITKKAIELGWLVSDGNTPEATMLAQIGTNIKKLASSDKKSLFTKHGRGYFGLAEWNDPIQTEIDKHNSAVFSRILSKLRAMPPSDFEKLIKRLLDEMDFFDTEVTKASNDGGIDVRGTWRVADGIEIRMAIQAKRWKNNVQAPVVDNVRGALRASERGMIITTSNFSKGAIINAKDKEKSSTISLINGEQLVKLLVQYGIGVKRKSIEILEFDKDFGL